MTVGGFVLADGAPVFSDVRATEIEVAMFVGDDLLIDSSVRAIIFDLRALRVNVEADVLSAPCACFRAFHYSVHVGCLP
jgi:hypothetical protein